jgi:hypothetical protein
MAGFVGALFRCALELEQGTPDGLIHPATQAYAGVAGTRISSTEVMEARRMEPIVRRSSGGKVNGLKPLRIQN